MNINAPATSWTEAPLPLLDVELDELVARHLAEHPAPNPAVLARARAVVISAESDAYAMNVQTTRNDPRPGELRSDDRARIRVLGDEPTGDVGVLAREVLSVHSAALDATDNLDRLAFLVAFLARRAGIDLTAAIREYDAAASLVARHGEGADYMPPSRSIR